MLGSQAQYGDPGGRPHALVRKERGVLDGRGQVGAEREAGCKELEAREDKGAVGVAVCQASSACAACRRTRARGSALAGWPGGCSMISPCSGQVECWPRSKWT